MRTKVKINLALQGGGAHGAFTWGVLDRLLEEPDIAFGWISAASAGTVNAVALAAGLAEGSRDAARAKLFKIWEAVHKSGVPDLAKLNPFLNGFSRPASMAQIATMWSPYEFNPLGFDPLRRLITDHVDFDLIRAKSPVEFLVAATHVATGRARLFRRQELTVEAVLASACLPTLHHAVEIDGQAFWDGGFSANPDLVTLALESPVRDSLIVQLNPLVRNVLPTGAREIAGHVNRLTFNAPILRDVEVIDTVRRTARRSFSGKARGPLAALANHHFHLIEAGRYTAMLPADSKLKPDWAMFTRLHGYGRTEAAKWLTGHRRDVGRRSSVDLAARYLHGRPGDEPIGDEALVPPIPDAAAGDPPKAASA